MEQAVLDEAATLMTCEWRRRPGCEQLTVQLRVGSDPKTEYVMVEVNDPDYVCSFKVPIRGSYTAQQLIAVVSAFYGQCLVPEIGKALSDIQRLVGVSSINFDDDWKQRGGTIE